MQNHENKVEINHFVNYYCDCFRCAIDEFIKLNDEEFENLISKLSDEEKRILTEYAVLKNKEAGVKKLYIKTDNFLVGKDILEKYSLEGGVIISAKNYQMLPSSALIGDGLILEIESLLDYNASLLSDIVDFLSLTKTKVLIKLGQDLEEVGKLVNLYSRSPVEILEDFGFLDRDCYLYGLNFIDKEDQKLLMQYKPFLIFLPRSDGLEGKGAINLYNFIYNDLKFGFSSGNCYNIDMLAEGRLAKINTNNLMFDNSLVDDKLLLQCLTCEYDDQPICTTLEKDLPTWNLFENKILLPQEANDIRQEAKEIIKKYKEKN